MSSPFYAEIRMYPYTFAPQGWARCDGQLIDISQNAALYSLIGSIYGGDGRVSMALPNLKGRSPMHSGTAPGLTPRHLGEWGGSVEVVLTQQTMPAHDHPQFTAGFGNPTTDQASPDTLLGPQKTPAFSPYKVPFDGADPQTPLNSASVAVAGASQGHENRQPFLAIPFCICMDGMYPSRN